MKYNDKGADVRELQLSLIQHGYKLPTYGPDGHLGDETWDALQQYAEDHNISWNPELPSGMPAYVNAPRELPSATLSSTVDANLDGVRMIDLRHEQPNPPPPVGGKMKMRIGRNGKVVERNPLIVDSVTIHQTAVRFGVLKRDIIAAGGDRELAMARRAKRVACHALAFNDGFFAVPNSLDWYVYHGNGFNKNSLGLEIDGRFAGLKDDPSTVIREDWRTTWGGKPDELTEELIMASRAALKFLVEGGRDLGMPITKVHAHRQTSATRRSDPGQLLWEEVVLNYGVPVLGLSTEPGLVLRDGRPIPREWDPNGVGKY